jgi:phospholipase/carboxylesterase
MKNNAVIVEPPEQANAAVIWLHGLGANGHDFKPILPALPKKLTAHTRFVFPNAPHRAITINSGMMMPGWYDILAMDLTAQQDAEGIHQSEKILCDYIANELEQGILAQNIVLAGFSQGGAIALHTGLRYPVPLAGIMALSTYLPLAETLEHEMHTANRQTSIFMAHGQWDPVILFSQAERSRTQLEAFGYPVQWHSYHIQHSLSPDEVVDIGQWLTARLPHN